jgi:dTDP-4-amino-4,6-dideoxygalactose transaminase
MTTGTGGMIITQSNALNTYSRSVRIHGSSTKGTSEIVNCGNDWFMDEFRAVIGYYQLQDLDTILKTRRSIAKKYNKKIDSLLGISIFPVSSSSEPSFYKYPVQLEPEITADTFKQTFLEKYHIELESLYWPPCHLQPLYRQKYHFKDGDFPVAEAILRQQICLPIHTLITDEDIDYIIQGLEELL